VYAQHRHGELEGWRHGVQLRKHLSSVVASVQLEGCAQGAYVAEQQAQQGQLVSGMSAAVAVDVISRHDSTASSTLMSKLCVLLD
jgi:hypothetical protein